MDHNTNENVVINIYELNAEVDKHCTWVMNEVDSLLKKVYVRSRKKEDDIEEFRTEIMQVMYRDYEFLFDEMKVLSRNRGNLSKEYVKHQVMKNYSLILNKTQNFLIENKIKEVI